MWLWVGLQSFEATYCLALAMFLSILLPVRKVKPPRTNRYFRVANMFCEEEG